jgi:hypothetical protein
VTVFQIAAQSPRDNGKATIIPTPGVSERAAARAERSGRSRSLQSSTKWAYFNMGLAIQKLLLPTVDVAHLYR